MVQRQDLLSKLADRGEDVVGRIGDIPGAQRLLEAGNTLKDRVDELQKKMRGLDALERRVASLERKVDQLSGGTSRSRSSTPKSGAAKKATTKRRAKPKPSS